MKLFKYQTLEELNAALDFFAKEKMIIKKVKLCTESQYSDQYRRMMEVTRFYILTDDEGLYQPDKTEEKPKKKK